MQDISDPVRSIVAISNGHISGRSVGGPITNKALKFLNDPRYTGEKFVSNYRGKSVSGKALRSSTYFIRDENGKLQGFLCINQDQDRLRHIRGFIDEMLGEQHIADNETETMTNSVEALALDSIEALVKSYGVDPERLSPDEKIEIIKRLNENSIFLLKGTVPTVAKFLKVSEELGRLE